MQAVLDGIKPCIVGIIAATGLEMIFQNCFQGSVLDVRAVILTAILGAVVIIYRRAKKKNFPPIRLIVISAVLGIAAYSL